MYYNLFGMSIVFYDIFDIFTNYFNFYADHLGRIIDISLTNLYNVMCKHPTRIEVHG